MIVDTIPAEKGRKRPLTQTDAKSTRIGERCDRSSKISTNADSRRACGTQALSLMRGELHAGRRQVLYAGDGVEGGPGVPTARSAGYYATVSENFFNLT